MKKILTLAVSVLIAQAAGVVGSVFTVSAVATWYVGLAKPLLNPPSWVFGPVWTLLYTLMGVAAWRVYEKGKVGAVVRPVLIVYAVHLCVNALWSVVFFGLHEPAAALGVIVLLDLLVAYLTLRFYRIDRAAGLMMLQYLAWVLFASYLNAMIVLLNP